MADAANGFYEATILAATDPNTGLIDYDKLAAKLMIVPKNSGIQNVNADIMHTEGRARRFKPPFRLHAMLMPRADKIGMLSISSELGAYAREFNTARTHNVEVGSNVGPAVDGADELVYGKKYTQNNPKKKGEFALFG